MLFLLGPSDGSAAIFHGGAPGWYLSSSRFEVLLQKAVDGSAARAARAVLLPLDCSGEGGRGASIIAQF
jgi:hypothetical protein